jgi:hypothetical protein
MCEAPRQRTVIAPTQYSVASPAAPTERLTPRLLPDGAAPGTRKGAPEMARGPEAGDATRPPGSEGAATRASEPPGNVPRQRTVISPTQYSVASPAGQRTGTRSIPVAVRRYIPSRRRYWPGGASGLSATGQERLTCSPGSQAEL